MGAHLRVEEAGAEDGLAPRRDLRKIPYYNSMVSHTTRHKTLRIIREH
jgi:hypothetical protein